MIFYLNYNLRHFCIIFAIKKCSFEIYKTLKVGTIEYNLNAINVNSVNITYVITLTV